MGRHIQAQIFKQETIGRQDVASFILFRARKHFVEAE